MARERWQAPGARSLSTGGRLEPARVLPVGPLEPFELVDRRLLAGRSPASSAQIVSRALVLHPSIGEYRESLASPDAHDAIFRCASRSSPNPAR